MNNVIDEVLAGEPRYTIKDNGGTTLYDNVQIDLKTQVTTAGTPLNKALFDSIATDINSRLLISNKATTSEAQTGTNDTKYITPKKVQDKLNGLIATDTQSTASTHTVCTFANYTNAKIITISGKISGSNGNFIINGSGLGGFTSQGNVSGGTSLNLSHANSNSEQPFIFRFDLISKSFIGHYVADISNTPRSETICGRFSSITNFQIRITSGRSFDATIQLNS